MSSCPFCPSFILTLPLNNKLWTQFWAQTLDTHLTEFTQLHSVKAGYLLLLEIRQPITLAFATRTPKRNCLSHTRFSPPWGKLNLYCYLQHKAAQDTHHLLCCLKCDLGLQSRTNFKIRPKCVSLWAVYSVLEGLLWYPWNFWSNNEVKFHIKKSTNLTLN